MNTGQMMLTAGALVLLGTTVLTVNTKTLQHGAILTQTEFGIYAVSLATSYMEKAAGLDFDEVTAGSNPVSSTTQLSTVLGRDGAEVMNNETTFNDFDDYNGFNKPDTAQNVGVFIIQAQLSYVDVDNNFLKTATRTFCKRMDMAVIPPVNRSVYEGTSSTGGVDTVKFMYIFSYFQ
jgi:hypothetical protein